LVVTRLSTHSSTLSMGKGAPIALKRADEAALVRRRSAHDGRRSLGIHVQTGETAPVILALLEPGETQEWGPDC